MESASIRFAGAARELSRGARLCGLTPPVFTSPPRVGDVSRSIRRRAGATTVAVRIRSRPWAAVLADMIEGVLVANDITGVEADHIRGALWLAVLPAVEEESSAADAA